MISRCSEARDRTTNRSEWSSETTTETTTGGYRRSAVTSIDATRTELSVATGVRSGPKIPYQTPARPCDSTACRRGVVIVERLLDSL